MRTLQKLQSSLGLALLLGISATGCNPSSSGDPTPSPTAGAPSSSAAPQTAQAADQPPSAAAPEQAGPQAVPDVSNLDDYSLAAILQSTHQRIAQQAQLAERSARSADVKQLSHDMFALHSGAMNSEQYLFQRLALVPHPGVVSQQIDTDAAHTIQTLHADRGTAFDRDYLDAQLQTFRDSIQLFDRMYGVAKAPDLRSEIARNRPDLVAGMQYVTRLQQQVSPGVTNMQPK